MLSNLSITIVINLLESIAQIPLSKYQEFILFRKFTSLEVLIKISKDLKRIITTAKPVGLLTIGTYGSNWLIFNFSGALIFIWNNFVKFLGYYGLSYWHSLKISVHIIYRNTPHAPEKLNFLILAWHRPDFRIVMTGQPFVTLSYNQAKLDLQYRLPGGVL